MGSFFYVLGLFCVVLFEGFLSYKKCLNFLDLSRQKNLSSTPFSMMLPFHAPVLLLMAHEAHGSYQHENFGGILYPRPWIQYPRLWIQDACKVHALMIVTQAITPSSMYIRICHIYAYAYSCHVANSNTTSHTIGMLGRGAKAIKLSHLMRFAHSSDSQQMN